MEKSRDRLIRTVHRPSNAHRRLIYRPADDFFPLIHLERGQRNPVH